MVATQAASANQTMTSEKSSIGRKSEASASRQVTTAYIPSGKTRLQWAGAYASG